MARQPDPALVAPPKEGFAYHPPAVSPLNDAAPLADGRWLAVGQLGERWLALPIDFDFYVALASLSGNQVMLLLINTVRDGVRGFIQKNPRLFRGRDKPED